MSFILSALKKVENKRNLGAVPELSSLQVQSYQRSDNHRYRVGIILSVSAFTVVAIMLSALWLLNMPPQATTVELKTPTAMTASTTAGNNTVPSVPQSPPSAPTYHLPPQQYNNNNVARPPPSYTSPALSPGNLVSPAPTYHYPPQHQYGNSSVAVPSPTYQSPPSPQLYQNPSAAPNWEPLPVGIVNYEELPSGLRQRIPNIKLSAHIHSDIRPQARKVIINGVALREGQRLSDDLTVHHINVDGVVMDYQGTLFLLSKTSIFN